MTEEVQTLAEADSALAPEVTATKKALTARGIEFETVDLSQDAAALERLRAQGFMSAPVVVTEDDAWSGFRPDKIMELTSKTEARA